MELEFRKPKKRMGEDFEQGYYFKGEFIHRLKYECLKILRERIKDLSEKERNETDEWKVIHTEYLKSCEAIEKTRKTKQPYFDKINKRTLERRGKKLKEKIEDIKERKQIVMNEFDERIIKIKNQINDIERRIKYDGKSDTEKEKPSV
jgi:hypothetical protein